MSEEPARSHSKARERKEGRRKSTHSYVQAELEKELMRLKLRLKIEDNLKVDWSPRPNGRLSGEVKGKVIFVYEDDLGKAIGVLRHELFDYLISQPFEPYRRLLNKFIESFNDDVYKMKERVVQAFTGLIGESEEEPFKEKSSKKNKEETS